MLSWLRLSGWLGDAHWPDIAAGPERKDFGEVVLEYRLRDALASLNPSVPDSALDDAYRKMTGPEGSTLEARNRVFHRMLVNGVTVEYRDVEGKVRGD